MIPGESNSSPSDLTEGEEVRLACLARLIPALVHRANNSLAVMRGACDLALHRGSTDHLARAVGETDLLARLLALLSLSAKTHPPAAGLFDVETLVGEVGEFLASLLETEEVEVKLTRDANVSSLVSGDSARFQQLLIWLAAEAAHFARVSGRADPGRLRLTLERRGARFRLSLLFGGTSGGRMPWSSAALRACREWAERGDARLDLRSRFGVFSCARFHLPAHEPLAPATAAASPIRAPRRRVLLFEDDEMQRDLIRVVLEESGYEVHPSESDELEISGLGVLDLVLVDADVERDRPGLLRKLATTVRNTPRLGIAILGDPPAHGDLAALPRLAKPFRPGELLQLVEESTY